MGNITDKIVELFDNYGVSYKLVEHEPVITSDDAAKMRDTDISMGAKALVFLADKEPAILVLPGDKKVDFKSFKKQFGIKDLSMANPNQLEKLTGLTKGAVPPVGKVFGIKTYFDDTLKNKDKIAFNAGSHTISIYMNAKDLLEVEEPVFGDFSIDR